MRFPDYKTELACLEQGFEYIIGCDEAGRGPLAGPVVAAACVLKSDSIGHEREGSWHERVRDSKTVSEAERETLAEKIMENSLAWAVGEVSADDVDNMNIHEATLLAMRRAVDELSKKFETKNVFILVDGRFNIPVNFPQECVIKGDGAVLSIAAASILAKVHRDKIMREYDAKFPEYGFAKHKGYGTKEHYRAIEKVGISPVHRKTFIA